MYFNKIDHALQVRMVKWQQNYILMCLTCDKELLKNYDFKRKKKKWEGNKQN